MTASYLSKAPIAARQPPEGPSWARGAAKNLFGDPLSAALSLGALVFVALALAPLTRFLLLDAVWRAETGAACRASAGACWAFVAAKINFFIYGAYPPEFYWRVDLTFALAAGLLVWLLSPGARGKIYAAIGFFVVLPICGFALLYGAPALGLKIVPTSLWGGVLVSLLTAIAGMVAALPGGLALALGRRSALPVFRWLSIGVIEFVRGAPLIAVLFMANAMLPLFLPPDWAPDRLVRPLIGVAIFASAYMAEVLRAGLLAVPRGQDEAGKALGLGALARLRLIVLPQALTVAIPAIVNNFVALFKDTTLVAIVGIFDFLHSVEVARLDPVWAGPTIAATSYVFAGMFYLSCCLGLSAYARGLEGRLSTTRRTGRI